MAIPFGQKVLWEVEDPQGPDYPRLLKEGRVMDPTNLGKCTFTGRDRVYSLLDRGGCVVVNTGIYEFPKSHKDVHVVRESELIF